MCGGCVKHAATCIYDRDDRARFHSATGLRPGKRARDDDYIFDMSPGVSSSDTANDNTSISKTRHLLELKLLHQYNTRTSQTLLTSDDRNASESWNLAIPEKAFKHQALLHAIYTLSALHLAEAEPSDSDIVDTHRQYLDLAIREHNNDLQNLNESNFDAVIVTSSFLRLVAFAMLQDRSLEPYAPPMQWLDISKGAVQTFEASWKFIQKDEESIAARLVRRMPLIWDEEAKFKESNRRDFLHLLNRTDGDVQAEPWSVEIQEAYESTISYIGCIFLAMKGDEQSSEICRRLVIFPYFIKSRFIDLVREQRPRALAVLAHYFALLTSMKDVWWVGNSGQREFRALSGLLSSRREDFIEWPSRFISKEAFSYQIS